MSRRWGAMMKTPSCYRIYVFNASFSLRSSILDDWKMRKPVVHEAAELGPLSCLRIRGHSPFVNVFSLDRESSSAIASDMSERIVCIVSLESVVSRIVVLLLLAQYFHKQMLKLCLSFLLLLLSLSPYLKQCCNNALGSCSSDEH